MTSRLLTPHMLLQLRKSSSVVSPTMVSGHSHAFSVPATLREEEPAESAADTAGELYSPAPASVWDLRLASLTPCQYRAIR